MKYITKAEKFPKIYLKFLKRLRSYLGLGICLSKYMKIIKITILAAINPI